MIKVCTKYVQSMYKVCTKYVQSMYKAWGYIGYLLECIINQNFWEPLGLFPYTELLPQIHVYIYRNHALL